MPLMCGVLRHRVWRGALIGHRPRPVIQADLGDLVFVRMATRRVAAARSDARWSLLGHPAPTRMRSLPTAVLTRLGKIKTSCAVVSDSVRLGSRYLW
jgi:hypothetical protein